MKKRLLALALCLVMMTSLLPLTAAADSPLVLKSVTLKASGVEQRSDGLYYVNITSAIGTYDGGETDIKPHLRELSCCLRFLNTGDGINMPPEKGITYRLDLNFQVSPTSVTLENAKIPVKLEIPGYATECH